jgi:hypothetical protein
MSKLGTFKTHSVNNSFENSAKNIMLKNVVLWHMPTTNISPPTQFFWHENLPRGDRYNQDQLG